MTQQVMTPGYFTPTVTDFDAEVFGIPVAFYGDEGAVVMLGHIEPRKAATIVLTHARRFAGLTRDDLCVETVEEALDPIQHAYMTFARHSDGCPGLNGDEGPCRCANDYAWWGETCPADDPNAHAVTLWEV